MQTIEFYSKQFFINKNVLVPRPETEDLVELFRDLIRDPNRIIEVGTGSGALIITLFFFFKQSTLIATDVSQAALKVAAHNIEAHGARVELVNSNLIDGIELDPSDIIIANLPYLSLNSKYLVRDSLSRYEEPDMALYAGKTGLELILTLFDSLKERPQYIFIESDLWQQPFVVDKALEKGYELVRQYRLITVFARQE